ncbi:MAG: phage portal protein [Victivallales bacterium]|nr:phage portal protein [Victivallales bacterium]
MKRHPDTKRQISTTGGKSSSTAKKMTSPQNTALALANMRKLLGYMAVQTLTARYDSLQRRNDPTRPRLQIRTDLTETEQWFSAERRRQAYAQCDELNDNTSVGSSIDTACRLTIGDKLEPVFTGEDSEYWQAAWEEWARHCGHAEDEDWHTMLGIALRAVLKHGDCLCVCDPMLTGGKLRIWDADQICSITGFDQWLADRGAPQDWRQVEGVVMDAEGRVQGYFATSLRNRDAVSPDDAIYLPRGVALRLSLKRKITEYRGEPTAILRQEQVSADSKDLLKSEIQSARLASELSLVVKQSPGFDSSGIGGILEGFGGDDKNKLTEGTEITDADLALLTEAARDSKTFAAFGDRAAIANVPAGTDIQNLTPQRPSNQVMAWQGMLDTACGKSLGMMSCLSNGTANNSYSSGEIELEISWAAFREYAKMLSRLVDYCAARICPHQRYEISYTEPIAIDAEKLEKVENLRLQSGRSTLREQLGPSYKRQLEQLAYEKKLLERLDLTNLAPFWQTTSGQPIQEQTPGVTATAQEQDMTEGNP